MCGNAFITVAENNSLLVLRRDRLIKAVIQLNEGARLARWEVGENPVIGEPQGGYKSHFASAIMVPFVNRINNGVYHLDGKTFSLPKNGQHHHAIHGLLHHGNFTVEEQILQEEMAQIGLSCHYDGVLDGYPFPFETRVTYRFMASSLDLTISVKNTGTQLLPLTMGWHPYFYVADPGKAQLDFNLKAEYQTDETGITTGFKRREEAVSLTMSEELDHAFLLKDNKVLFQNGHRCLEIFFPKADNYLQVYTPNDENYLAIEPMTGISDSFNNKIGLQILEPQRSMSRVWKIYLRQNAN